MPAASRPQSSITTSTMACGGGKKRQRQQSELCGDDLPSSQKQREHEQPRRKPPETLENSKTNAGKGRQGKNNGQCSAGSGEAAGVGPIAFDLIRPERGERCRHKPRGGRSQPAD